MKLTVCVVLLVVLALLLPDESAGWWPRRRRRRRSCGPVVHCSWGNWGCWGTCTAQCGDWGTQTRTRSVARAAQCGGSGCSGPSTETQNCNRGCRRGRLSGTRCSCAGTGYTGTCCDIAPAERSVKPSVSYGGSGGSSFSDEGYETHGEIKTISVWSASWVDAIQVTYGNQKAPRHGGRGGSERIFYLRHDERITQIKIWVGWYVNKVDFITNHGRSFQSGGRGGQYHEANAPHDYCYLKSIKGREASYLDQLSFRWQC